MAPVLGDQVFDRSHTRPQAIRRYCAIRCAAHDGQDRKSTRLNSSHSQISYAVFCLKKKKKTVCAQAIAYLIILTDLALTAPCPYYLAVALLYERFRYALTTLFITSSSDFRASFRVL